MERFHIIVSLIVDMDVFISAKDEEAATQIARADWANGRFDRFSIVGVTERKCVVYEAPVFDDQGQRIQPLPEDVGNVESGPKIGYRDDEPPF